MLLAMGTAEPAETATTSVEHEAGQWVVYLTVIFHDGVVQRRSSTHRSEDRARTAASWIQRASNRDVETPGDVGRPPAGPAPQERPEPT